MGSRYLFLLRLSTIILLYGWIGGPTVRIRVVVYVSLCCLAMLDNELQRPPPPLRSPLNLVSFVASSEVKINDVQQWQPAK